MKDTISLHGAASESVSGRFAELVSLPKADRLRLLEDSRGVIGRAPVTVITRVLVRSVTDYGLDQE